MGGWTNDTARRAPDPDRVLQVQRGSRDHSTTPGRERLRPDAAVVLLRNFFKPYNRCARQNLKTKMNGRTPHKLRESSACSRQAVRGKAQFKAEVKGQQGESPRHEKAKLKSDSNIK